MVSLLEKMCHQQLPTVYKWYVCWKRCVTSCYQLYTNGKFVGKDVSPAVTNCIQVVSLLEKMCHQQLPTVYKW